MKKNRIKSIAIVVTPLRGKSVTKTAQPATMDKRQWLVFETMGRMVLDLEKTRKPW